LEKVFDKHEWVKAVRGADISSSEYRVLLNVYSYTNGAGERAYPSVARLAQDCRLSESSVKNSLRALEKMAWLRKVKRGGRSGNGTTRATEYALAYPISTGNELPVQTLSTGKTEDVNRQNGASQQVTRYPPSCHKTSVHKTSGTRRNCARCGAASAPMGLGDDTDNWYCIPCWDEADDELQEKGKRIMEEKR
jgi:hypothetical protein